MNRMAKSEEEKKIEYIVACINEFSKETGLNAREAFRYLHYHGGITFLIDYYETEHMLSFGEVIGDLKKITRQTGGMIA
jgi:hypothetical protein